MGKDTKIGLLVGVLVVVLFALVFFGGGSGTEEDLAVEAVPPEVTRPMPEPAVRPAPEPQRITPPAREWITPPEPERVTPPEPQRTTPPEPERIALLEAERTTPPEPAPLAGGTVYEVQPGDSYYSIAKTQYGRASLWPALRDANEGKDLFPGMKIIIPPRRAEPSAAGTRETTPSTPLGPNEYEVQPGDSLWKIAARHFGSGAKFTLIFAANTDVLKSPDQTLRAGMRLRLPAKDAAPLRRVALEARRAAGVRTARRADPGATGRRPADID